MKRTINKDLDPNSSKLNHTLYKLGCNLFNKAKYKKAAKAFTESLEYWPEDPQAWFALGDCYDELNKPEKAEKCFRKSLQYTAPNEQSDVLYNLGNSLLDQAKFSEAIKCYNKVSAQSSTYKAAQKNMERAQNGNSNKNS
jgi:tetratricopeptide (TPR) repeat protein